MKKQSLHLQAFLNSSFHTNPSFLPKATNIVCFFEMAGPFYYILRQCIIKSWAWITRAFLLLDLTKSDISKNVASSIQESKYPKSNFSGDGRCYILFYHRGYQKITMDK